MNWDIEYTDEFGNWWEELTESEQSSVAASVKLLGQFGPGLRFPHSSAINDEHLETLRKEGCNNG
ncbi:hypothetical protein KVQ82_29850 [Pseudomonas sp. AO-1]|uniref:hypothetical protein n=1 Tax=Pseudomonas sp. AO-1 TaxID=2855434 RepID=UPI001C7650A1|nr:hypothetical protein [Pseudomonas sp. AO-1]QXZ14208.1 hypothetical protein KVQ82_29850 [Pseudomonas sp. AO-1]